MNQRSVLLYRNIYTESFLKVYVFKIFFIFLQLNVHLVLNEFLLRVCTILMSKIKLVNSQLIFEENAKTFWKWFIRSNSVVNSCFWSSPKSFGITKTNSNFQKIGLEFRSLGHKRLSISGSVYVIVWGKNGYKSTTKGQRVEPWHW